MSDYIQCGIADYFDLSTEQLTVHVYMKDKDNLVFHNVLNDPLFSGGFLRIEYDVFGTHMGAIVRESEVKHITYYTKPKDR